MSCSGDHQKCILNDYNGFNLLNTSHPAEHEFRFVIQKNSIIIIVTRYWSQRITTQGCPNHSSICSNVSGKSYVVQWSWKEQKKSWVPVFVREDRSFSTIYQGWSLTSSRTNLSDGTKPLPPFSPASLPLTSVGPMRRPVATSNRGDFATVSFERRLAISGGIGALIVILFPMIFRRWFILNYLMVSLWLQSQSDSVHFKTVCFPRNVA